MLAFLVVLLTMQYVCMDNASKGRASAVQSKGDDTKMVVFLPDGFYPPSPPTKPLLYPFEKEHLSRSTLAQPTDTDWRPILPSSTQAPTVIAKKRKEFRDGDETRYNNHRYESYGPWQPVSPLLADQLPMQQLNKAQDRNFVVIGGKRPAYNNRVGLKKISKEKEFRLNKTINLEVIIENTTQTPTVIQEYREVHTTMPPEIWPRDFLNNSNSQEEEEEQLEVEEHDYLNDNFEQSTDVNITKMGVPFEHNDNSTENATICVPLTVQAQKSAKNVVEYEKIYCFPLPNAENENKENITNNNATHKDTNPMDLYKFKITNSAECSWRFYNYYAVYAILLQLIFINS